MLEEPMKLEQAAKWEPVEGIVTPVARAMIAEDHGVVVTLVFSEMVNGLQTGKKISAETYGPFGVRPEGPSCNSPDR